jgi:hypothetical protein
MPIKMGKKKYKSFGGAAGAIAKKKGISKERAAAYVAAVERAQGVEPATGKKIKKKKTSKQKKK